MLPARCWWPIFDIDIEDARAKLKAVGQIPRIAAENGWASWGEPTHWRYEEGYFEGEPTLFLVCDIAVVVTPTEYRNEVPA